VGKRHRRIRARGTTGSVAGAASEYSGLSAHQPWLGLPILRSPRSPCPDRPTLSTGPDSKPPPGSFMPGTLKAPLPGGAFVVSTIVSAPRVWPDELRELAGAVGEREERSAGRGNPAVLTRAGVHPVDLSRSTDAPPRADGFALLAGGRDRALFGSACHAAPGAPRARGSRAA
jgi:hypothetical protein